jgi:hypothetical protein
MSSKGFKNLVWFMGVVEDRNEGAKLGRVKVRCFGFHTEDKILLPTADLPWAYLISGNYSSAITIPAENSWVWGFFIDGEYAQQPMLVGMMMGMPTQATLPSEGFSANSQELPVFDLNQPDISRLARGENIEQTSVAYKNITAICGVPSADGTSWSQPNSPYNASYPHNFVHETKAGHVFELDDTPGAERINLYHTAGSYVEMDSNGTTVIKSGGNMYMVIEADGRISITGDYSVTATGSINLLAKNDMNIQVDGNLKTNVHGNYELNVAGYMNTNVGEAIRTRGLKVALESQDDFDIFSGTEFHLGAPIISAKSSGDIFLNSVSGNLELKAGVNANIYGVGDANIRSASNVNLQSATINVNASGTVYIDNLVDMANGAAGPAIAAIAANGLTVNRTELKSEDVPDKKSPVKKTAIAPESTGIEAIDDTAEYGPQ